MKKNKNKKRKNTGDSNPVKRVSNQLQRVVDTDYFQSRVLKIRSELGIPPDGFEMTERDKNHLGSMFYVPERAGLNGESDQTNFLRRINVLIRPLVDRLVVRSTILNEVVKCYVCYNSLEVEAVSTHIFWREKTGLCETVDLKMELQQRFSSGAVDPELAATYVAELMRKTDQYPVIIRIHPDASRTDFFSYLKKNWYRVKNIQVQYPVDPAKTVKNDKVNVNAESKKIKDFVYKNRRLRLAEIATKMRQELGEIRDQGYIGKIRSLEIKKRQGE